MGANDIFVKQIIVINLHFIQTLYNRKFKAFLKNIIDYKGRGSEKLKD